MSYLAQIMLNIYGQIAFAYPNSKSMASPLSVYFMPILRGIRLVRRVLYVVSRYRRYKALAAAALMDRKQVPVSVTDG